MNMEQHIENWFCHNPKIIHKVAILYEYAGRNFNSDSDMKYVFSKFFYEPWMDNSVNEEDYNNLDELFSCEIDLLIGTLEDFL